MGATFDPPDPGTRRLPRTAAPRAKARRQSTPRPVAKLEYQPGLDGLRAVAVVAVMLYHAQQNMPTSWMPGGFLGVEVFFVISGYLITLLLVSEHQRTNRLDLKQFWVRRARRLLPALFALLIITMGIVGIGGRVDDSLQDHVKDFRGMWASAWVYATNWFQILAGLNYADKNGRPPLVRHLWSLAVEEQFYLVWPLIMWFVLKAFRRHLPAVGMAFFVIAIGIAVGMGVAYQPENIGRANFLYLSTLTRSSGLFLGAGLAMFWRPWLVPHSRARSLGRRFDVLALVGLAVLAATHLKWHFLVETEDGPRGYDLLFRGGFLIVGVATLLVILAITHPGSFVGQKILARQPLVWLGTRSYGLYLWHWPIFQLTRPIGDLSLLDPARPDVNLKWLPALALRFALTALVTELSYRFIETPIRTGAIGRWWTRQRESKYDDRGRVLGILGLVAAVVLAIPAASAFSATDLLEQQAACNRDPAACELTDGGNAAGPDDTAADTTDATKTTDVTGDSTASTTGDTEPADTSATSDDPATTAGTAATTPATTASNTVPVSDVKPLAIGDSVMLGAKAQLEKAGIQVDAKESRQFGKAVEILKAYRADGMVGDVVIIALATNGPISDEAVDKLMAELSKVRHVIFVTPQINGKTPEEANHEVLMRVPARYDNVTIVDWKELAKSKLKYFYKGGEGVKTANDAYFWKDKIHLAPKGQKYYAELIVAEIQRVS